MISAVENEPHQDRNAGRISTLFVTPSTFTGAHLSRTFTTVSPAGSEGGEGDNKKNFPLNRGKIARPNAVSDEGGLQQPSFYFAFLYFIHAIRIAMAPLGMIIKLVEPVSDGTNMKRMLMTSSGQTAVPMFLR